MELKEYRFDEVTVNFDKKRVPLSSAQRERRQGKYRYYGAQGVIDHIDDFIFDGIYLLIAEDGENLKSKKQNIAQVVEGQFWVNNHAHIVQGNELCDTRYPALHQRVSARSGGTEKPLQRRGRGGKRLQSDSQLYAGHPLNVLL